jgi:hypothetical protein
MAHQPQQSSIAPPPESTYETGAEEWATPKSPMRMRRKQGTQIKHDSPFKAIIDPRYAEEFKNFVAKNREKLHIDEDGRFDMNVSGKKISNSNYKDVLDYMTGEREGMPKGFKFLYSRLGKEPIVKNFINESKAKGESSRKTATSSTASKSGSSSYTSQSGDGKRHRRVHIIATAPPKIIKATKTKGLKRSSNSKFRPTLWAKL